MRKLYLLLLTIVLATTQLWAQKTITGKVWDENNNPVANATVQVIGTSIGTVTKADGTFTLSVPATARSLMVSFVNMESQEVSISGKTNFNVVMKSSEKELSEAVVTGINRVKKSQFVGAANKLDVKEIQNRPVGSFDQLFQGRVPGVWAVTTSGQPGQATAVLIRGTNSISGGSTPLYIVDGIQVEAAVFQNLNPNDFASIDVLRDAVTLATYGSRGSAGVIVVTTKRGTGSKMKLTYSGQYGIKSRPDFAFRPMTTEELLQAQEDYGLIVQGSSNTSTSIPGWYYSKKNPRYIALNAQGQAEADHTLDSIRGIHTNWYDQIFRQGTFQQHQIAVTGGTGKTRIYSSLAYYSEEGTTARTDMERLTLRNNIDYTDDKFTFSFTSNFGYTKRNFQQSTTTNSTANPFLVINIAVPYHIPVKADGSFNTGVGNKFVATNEMDLNKYDKNYNDQVKATMSVNMQYKLTKEITAAIVAGIDFRETQNTNYQSRLAFLRTPVATATLTTLAGSQFEDLGRNLAITVRPTINWRHQFNEKHDLDFTAVAEYIQENSKTFSVQGFGIDPRTPNTPGAITAGNSGNQLYILAGGNKDKTTLGSLLGIARYTYNGKYTLNASIRRDKSSILPPSTRDQSFYSFGASWDVKKERFMDNVNFINTLRLRGSWGSSGNANNFPGLYLGPATYGAGSYSGLVTQVSTYVGNPNATWERTFVTNVGLDFELCKRRIFGDLNWYDKHTKDLFVNKILSPSAAGNNTIPVNAGMLENEGVEWNVNAEVIRNRNFVWTVFTTGAYNKNALRDLGGEQPYPVGTSFLEIGKPLGSHYQVKWGGVDAATGMPLYSDKAGNLTNIYNASNSVANFGTFEPPWKGGFGTNLRYKTLELSVLFSWQSGAVKFDNLEYFVENPIGFLSGQFNQSSDMNMWKKPGDLASTPSPLYGTNFTSKLIHSSNFLRLRDVTMAYTLPATVMHKIKFMSNVKFYLQANNLFIWTKWRGMDPEAGPVNINLSEFPNPRAFTGGIDVTF
ncbi:MAG TPA: SusC/RagA family TonB-linked outer membrane protein [Chitinophagaceae bacterium]|nr:SusC/RagA family TonB-linked outer membrane protein [Chitinophagaceae bacterium]